MKKSLLQLIAEADDKAEDKPKKKFTVTVTDADGNEVQKTAMAYNIGDIKAYWASGARPDETFVKADLHDDEIEAAPTDELPSDEAPVDDASVDDEAPTDELPPDDEAPVDDEELDDEELDDEGKPKKKPKSDDPMAVDEEDKKKAFDRKLVLHGAMSKKDFDAKWNTPVKNMSAMHKRMAGPGGVYKNLIAGVPDKAAPKKESVAATGSLVTEMAKRTSPADFYKMVVAVHGAKGAESVSWADIKAVADKNDVLIPVYIRDQKVARGRWTAKPKDMKAPAHEPTVEKKPAASAAPAQKAPEKEVAKAAHAAVKDTPAMEYKEFYHKADFPDVEFAWTTTYHSGTDLLAAIEKHHGVKPEDTKRLTVDKRDNYYIVKKGTMDVLGRVTVTDGGIQPGRGRVAYVEGNIAISAKAKKERDDNLYGFWVKPQHGSPFVSVGTQHSHGPWSKFSAEANVRDKYEHYAYDDEFGHGTIQVVKVKKVNGKWERA